MKINPKLLENDNYSTTEEIIGTWLNKPLYRKVIDFGALPNNSSKSVLHGITNRDKIVNIHGYSYRSTDDTYITLPYSATGTQNVACYVNGSNVITITYQDRRNFAVSYIVLEYTKTTD